LPINGPASPRTTRIKRMELKSIDKQEITKSINTEMVMTIMEITKDITFFNALNLYVAFY
jgi:hypothetical protein